METGRLGELLSAVGDELDQFNRFEHPDAHHRRTEWTALTQDGLPEQGHGIDAVTKELLDVVVPGGARISEPTFWGYITTGPTTAPILAATAATLAGPQRYMGTAFNHLEERSLDWLRDLCGLPDDLRGVYSSGGSVANLVALGAARQWAFERRGVDVSASGVDAPAAVYASDQVHHTVQRACGVLGIGRGAVRVVPSDDRQRMQPHALRERLDDDARAGLVPVAIVGTAGTTNTGAIDPLRELADIAHERDVWFHVDGAYGLPGRLDERVAPAYDGVDAADSVIVDPHKWLAAPVGVAATYVRDRSLLVRAFRQEPSDYLEGSMPDQDDVAENSMDVIGVPYWDMALELSAPARGAQVWAILREQGREGVRARVRRDNDFARYVTQFAKGDHRLQALTEPTLSIACIRYIGSADDRDNATIDTLNRRLLRQLIRTTPYAPSATMVAGRYAIRPCFINPRTTQEHVDGFLQALLHLGDRLTA